MPMACPPASVGRAVGASAAMGDPNCNALRVRYLNPPPGIRVGFLRAFRNTKGYSRNTDVILVNNRRSEPRYPANQQATITPLDEPNVPGMNGKIIDFSASGMAIIAPVELPCGSRLQVEWPSGTVIAAVRNCRCLRPGTYRVGLAINEVTARTDMEGQIGAA